MFACPFTKVNGKGYHYSDQKPNYSLPLASANGGKAPFPFPQTGESLGY